MGENHNDHHCNYRRRSRHRNLLNIKVIAAVVLVYAINTLFVKPNFDAQFLHSYLNDLFAMPLILAYTNLLIHWLGRPSMAIKTPLRIGCLTVFCVIVWEGFTPMLLAGSTRDLFDVVAYSIGSFGYFAIVTASAFDNQLFVLHRDRDF